MGDTRSLGRKAGGCFGSTASWGFQALGSGPCFRFMEVLD